MPVVVVSRPDREVAGFFLDLAIAIGAMLFLSVACGMVWAMFKGAQLAMNGGGVPDSTAIMRMIGQPGALAMIWMTLVSTGGAALVVYFWRRRATPAERMASLQASRKISTWGWVLATAATTFLFSTAATSLSQSLGVKPEPTNLAIIEAAFLTNPMFLALFGVLIAPVDRITSDPATMDKISPPRSTSTPVARFPSSRTRRTSVSVRTVRLGRPMTGCT